MEGAIKGYVGKCDKANKLSIGDLHQRPVNHDLLTNVSIIGFSNTSQWHLKGLKLNTNRERGYKHVD
jgi:hypothetical protein